MHGHNRGGGGGGGCSIYTIPTELTISVISGSQRCLLLSSVAHGIIRNEQPHALYVARYRWEVLRVLEPPKLSTRQVVLMSFFLCFSFVLFRADYAPCPV